jgi:alpha-tubulin suppressor-like RCC1 family protein
MPNPITNFKDNYGTDLGNKLITKEYLMTVYPQIAANMITPELWVWGDNFDGQLGINNTANRSIPVTTSAGGANWRSVSGGSDHNAAIKTDGTLWTWGRNDFGVLGINVAGRSTNRTTPVTTFLGGTNWKQVATGIFNTAAIKTDGTLWIWGYNFYGQLGINVAGPTTNRTTPVTTFLGGTNWKQVSCGWHHTSAIKTDGTLWVWGSNSSGRLGINNIIRTMVCTPVQTFLGGTNWKQVSCGLFCAAAIKTDGTLWTWGSNSYGQLGVNDTADRSIPTQTFLGGTNWKQVSDGDNFTTAIKTDGTLWVWGDNVYGQLGVNDTANRSIPVTTFLGGTNWKQVSGGGAIKTDGTLWVWGRNGYGQLGTNDTADRSIPVTTFAGGTNWKSISKESSVVAIQSTDTL